MRIWHDTAQAAEHTGRYVGTVRKALEAGELHGHQRKAGGRWAIHLDCLDAWVGGTACRRHDGSNVVQLHRTA
jgi:hypothetical protein